MACSTNYKMSSKMIDELQLRAIVLDLFAVVVEVEVSLTLITASLHSWTTID